MRSWQELSRRNGWGGGGVLLSALNPKSIINTVRRTSEALSATAVPTPCLTVYLKSQLDIKCALCVNVSSVFSVHQILLEQKV
jgi:hypothetical protein